MPEKEVLSPVEGVSRQLHSLKQSQETLAAERHNYMNGQCLPGIWFFLRALEFIKGWQSLSRKHFGNIFQEL